MFVWRKVKTCEVQGRHRQTDKIQCLNFSTPQAWSMEFINNCFIINQTSKPPYYHQLLKYLHQHQCHWMSNEHQTRNLAATLPSVLKSSTTSSITLEKRRFTNFVQYNCFTGNVGILLFGWTTFSQVPEKSWSSNGWLAGVWNDFCTSLDPSYMVIFLKLIPPYKSQVWEKVKLSELTTSQKVPSI